MQLENVIHWLQKQLEIQLEHITDKKELESDWFEQNQFSSTSKNLIKMVAIMGNQFQNNPPLGLAILGLQFRERIQFGIYFATPNELCEYHNRFKTNISPQLPIYLLFNYPDLIVYNVNNFEPLSYVQVDGYLRGLLPELSDIYLVLFSMLNLCLGLNFFWTRCMSACKHLSLCLVKTVEINLILGGSTIMTSMLSNNVFVVCNFVLPQNTISSLSNQITNLFQSLWSSKWAFYFRSQLLSSFAFERHLLAFLITGLLLGEIFVFSSNLINYLYIYIFN